MDGIDFLLNRCRKYGVDKGIFVTGITEKVIYKAGGRYKKSSMPRTRTAINRYVVLYVEEGKFYIVWSLQMHKANSKSIFSISAHRVNTTDKSSVTYLNKNIEYSGWNEETVCVFGESAVDSFFEIVVCPEIQVQAKP